MLKLAAGSSTQTELPFTGLNNPEGVAVDAAGDRLRHRLTQQSGGEVGGGASTQTVLPFTGLHLPRGVAVDTAGNVYVTEWQQSGGEAAGGLARRTTGARNCTAGPGEGPMEGWRVATWCSCSNRGIAVLDGADSASVPEVSMPGRLVGGRRVALGAGGVGDGARRRGGVGLRVGGTEVVWSVTDDEWVRVVVWQWRGMPRRAPTPSAATGSGKRRVGRVGALNLNGRAWKPQA